MPVAAAAMMVGPGDLRVRKFHGLLTCVGLRSGVCLSLYDPIAQVSGMAHVMESDSPDANPSLPGRYVSSAVEALIDAMERIGAKRANLQAAIVSGPDFLIHADESDSEGMLTIPSISRALELEVMRAGLPLGGKEIGGKEERNVVLDAASGTVQIRTPGKARFLCDLSRTQQAALAA